MSNNLVLVVKKVECNGTVDTPQKLVLKLGNVPLGTVDLDKPDKDLKFRFDPEVHKTGSIGLYKGETPHYVSNSNIRLDKETKDEKCKLNGTGQAPINVKVAIHYSILNAG
ncbi:hypothetical protein IFO70_01590 [Phormidium tenue FACHB-886]|nr:hypothetical protein [Phormidium tenue FACHB-886]